VGVLSNGWCGCLAGTNGPDGLISDNDVGPILDGGLHSIKLLLEDVICLIGFPLLKSLTDAQNDLETSGLGALNLLRNGLISLIEELSTLGVANEGPL